MTVPLRYKLVSVLTVLLGVFLYGRCSRPITSSAQKPSAVLPLADKEQIIIDPVKHQLISLTQGSKPVTLTLPDRRSTIDILKDGTVKINSPQFGYEHSPFVGVFYSNALRYGAGVDGLYFKKLDLGIGGAGGAGCTSVAIAQVSYTVYDNVRLGITYDTSRHLGVGLTVRI